MTIDIDKYFMELTDGGKGTIGYYVTNPSRLLLEIHKQNKELSNKIKECEQKDKELLSNEKIINKLIKEIDELKQKCDCYHKVLKEIKEECEYAPMCDTEFSERVLDIINKVK